MDCSIDGRFPVRVAAAGVVVSDGRLLAVAFDDGNGHHYNLPGGGVEAGERVPDALVREVREETSARVSVDRLLFVWEYVPRDHGWKYGSTHELALAFRCELPDGERPALPEDPDPNQVGVEWLALEDLAEQPLVPDIGGKLERLIEPAGAPRYVTDL